MKQRVISAIVAAIIVVPIFLLGGWVFNLGVVVLASLAYLEILKLKESHKNFPNIIRVLGFLALVLVTLSGFNIGFYNMGYHL
jgi:CDP-diglyceride synthetase